MPTVDNLNIQIKANATSAIKSLDSLEKKLDRVSKSLNKSMSGVGKYNSKFSSSNAKMVSGLNKTANSMDKASKSAKSLAASFGMFYANFFLIIRGFKSLWKSIESTADYIESFNYFTVSMGKIASKWDSEWENYADESARNYSNTFFKTLSSSFNKMSGVSYDPKTGLLSETGLTNLGANLQEVTQYAAQLASMMDAVGQSGETTLATTNAFIKLAGDISSLYNIDYADAASKMRSVLQGQSRAGYGFGWDTTMASLQATADKLNLSKPVSEMEQFEKQQLRILTILQQSRVAWGDQANTINTLANQMRLLRNNLKEAGMMLGQLFIPFLQKAMPVVNGLTIAIKRLLGNIAGFMGVKIEDIGQGFTDVGEDFEDIEENINGATSAVDKFKTHALGIDELNIANLEDNNADDLNDTIDLTKEIVNATKEYEKVWQEAFGKMENNAQGIADAMSKYFQPLEDIIKKLVEPTEDFVKSIAELYAELAPFTTEFGKGFLDFFGTLSDVNLEIAASIIRGIAEAIGLLEENELEDIGYGLGILAGSLVTLSGISKLSTIFTNLTSGLAGLGTTIAAHPILSTFVLSAGILALFELPQKLASAKNEELYGLGWAKGFDELQAAAEKAGETVSNLSTILDNVITGNVNSELELHYEKWKDLSTQISSLTDNEKGLLRVYADKIVSLFPEAKKYIDENGVAYAGMADELERSVENAIKLAKIQGAEGLLGQLAGEEVQIEIDLQKSQEKLQDLLDIFKKELPKLSEDEIKKYLDAYSKTGTLYSGRYHILKAAGLDYSVSESKRLEELADEYVQLSDAVKTQEENLVEVQDALRIAVDYVSDLRKEYDNLGVKTNTVKNDFVSSSNVIDEIREKLRGLNKLDIVIPIKFNILKSASSAVSNSIGIMGFKTGGFPEDGLFMANHGELVGGFSNGKTAVANNAQIIDGIEGGVERAVSRVLAPYLADIAQNTRETANKEFATYIGDREIAKANNRGQRQLGAMLIT